MKLRYKIFIILVIIFFIILIISLIISFSMGMITSKQCERICESKGALIFQRITNNKWNLEDYCICYLEKEIETFQLNKND